MNKILTAFQFLTLLPITLKDFRDEDFAESTIYFPLVGFAFGLMLVGLEFILSPLLPLNIVAFIEVAFLAFVTRGLHLDGFADTVDGLGCVKTPEERLEVMKDSHIGTLGAVAVIFLILMKFNAIATIDNDLKIFTLLIFPVMGRWSMVLAIVFSSRTSHSGLGSKFQEHIKEKHLMLSSILPCLMTIYLFGFVGLALLIIIPIIVFITYRLLLKSFGKITGDHFGFINEMIEVAVLILVLIAVR